MLFHVYDDPKPDGYYSQAPDGFYLSLLNADWILYILLPLLLVIVIVGLMVAWHIHEIPHHRADKKKMRQAELVSALTLLGLFEHWVWAVALFFAYFDWDELENALVRVLRKAGAGRNTEASVVVVETTQTVPVAPSVAPAAPSPAKTEEGDA